MDRDILILTTGGTIDKVYYDAKSNYKVGEPQIINILANVNVLACYTIETLLQKDSLDLTSADRGLIRQRIAEAVQPGILITHGTDTMIETARSLGPITDKTVVLVGSLMPALFRATDAEFNIGFAFAAAKTLPPGVYVAMNGQVLDPGHARKNTTENRFEYF